MSPLPAGPRVLVAGIGNIFLGDDGFGVEAADQLHARQRRDRSHQLRAEPGAASPADVSVADYGIRGIHLAFELAEGWDAAVLLDAVPLGEPPGTLAVLEVEVPTSGAEQAEVLPPGMDAHSMSPAVVVRHLAQLGTSLRLLLVVACQPATLEEGIGLSAPVAAAVPRALDLVDEILVDLGAAPAAPVPLEHHT